MAKEGEIGILRRKGEASIQFGLGKPFSAVECPSYLMRIGAVLSLLRPPPGRLLDLGCGMGWTSLFCARRGYDVVGVDIAPDKIHYANVRKAQERCGNLHFRVSDYEALPYQEEFDYVLFFDALHHAVDEELALRMAHRALRPGGICITCEPGAGHADKARPRALEYNVTEKDMPPRLIRALAGKIGFRECHVYPQPSDLWLSADRHGGGFLSSLASRSGWAYRLRILYRVWRQLRHLDEQAALVVLTR